ncbi:MAG: hypothetical protein LUG60_09170 [Erysipelotrichaceae bacterium]|nr:hypothetical protein [Erysipelotrichaceae bacterium]
MRLTRRAKILFTGIFIIVFLVVAFLIIRPFDKEEAISDEEDVTYTVSVVEEDIDIAASYEDSISTDKSSTTYSECKVKVTAGTTIGDYTLTNDQTFSKYIQLVGPSADETIYSASSNAATHYAYGLLLTGDLIEKKNDETDEVTYEIVNAHITYNVVHMSLMDNENSAMIANQEESDEKLVSVQELINALNSVEQRDTMLEW